MADPLEDFARRDAEQDEWLRHRPVCSVCGDPIQDDYYYDIHDDCICPDCMDLIYRKENC